MIPKRNQLERNMREREEQMEDESKKKKKTRSVEKEINRKSREKDWIRDLEKEEKNDKLRAILKFLFKNRIQNSICFPVRFNNITIITILFTFWLLEKLINTQIFL